MRQTEALELGDIRVDGVMDGWGRFEPTKSFRGTTPEQWEVHRDLLDEDGLLPFSMGGFLIRTGDRVVLVDLGLGPRQWLGIQGGAFLTELRQLGVEATEVTDVLFTHLHFDHVGWATSDGRAVFPNADYRCAQADWDHFILDAPGAEAELLKAAEERFSTWDADGALLPGIDALMAPGHTPGSTVLVISSGVERAMLLGDVVHCPVELVDDEWASMFDMDPDLARKTRLALTKELEGSGVPTVAAHFPGLRFGRLLPGQGRRQWVL